MAKHTIKGFITWRKGYDGKPDVDFLSFDPRQFAHNDRAVVGEHSIEVEVPDDFDPRPDLIAQLEKQKKKVRAEFAKAVKEIDDRINSLLAIENAA